MGNRRGGRWDVLAAAPGRVAGSDVPPSRRGDRSIQPKMGAREHSVVGELGQNWRVHARVIERRGRLVVSYLELWPAGDRPPDQGLTGRDLREIRLTDVGTALLRRDSAFRRDWGVSILRRTSRKRMREAQRRKGGRRNSDFYPEVARRYLAALAAEPRRPVASMTEQFRRSGMRDVSPQKVRDWVHLARVYGWLTPGRQGYAGAEATRKLSRWLSAAHGDSPRR